VDVFPFDRCADYRRRAQEARSMASWMSLNDAKEQLLEHATHLDTLAETEERRIRQIAPLQVLKPET